VSAVAAKRRTARKRNRPAPKPWSEAHARRLLERAGLGATPQDLARYTKLGRRNAIALLLRGEDGPELAGSPATPDGTTLDPRAKRDDLVLWWLDRLVRSRHPLRDRLALQWHGHFATKDSELDLLVAQHELLRAASLGSFPSLLRQVTHDHAMLRFLDLGASVKEHPNENFPREMLELFALGSGYTEDDVRGAARAMTGFAAHKDGDRSLSEYDARRHDPGPHTIFGTTGAYDPDAVVDLVCGRREHGFFVVATIWSWFVSRPLDRTTHRELVRAYRRGGLSIAVVVRRILDHPLFYADLATPDLVRSPVVHVVTALRCTGVGVQRRAWWWLVASMGQMPSDPPSVAGWDEGPAWASSGAAWARFIAANYLVESGKGGIAVRSGEVTKDTTAQQHLALALAVTGQPRTTPALRRELLALAEKLRPKPAQCQTALRHLLLSGPEAQLH